jgi:hypothetical protein
MEGPGRQLPAAPGTPYEKGPGDPGPCLKASEAGFRPSWLQSGGDERDRTADLLVANEALSQLSYIPTFIIRYAFCFSIPRKIRLISWNNLLLIYSR